MGIYYFYGFLTNKIDAEVSVYSVGNVLSVYPGLIYKGVIYGSVISSLAPVDIIRGLLLWGETFGGFRIVELYSPGDLDYWAASWSVIKGKRHNICNDCTYGIFVVSLGSIDVKFLFSSSLSTWIMDSAERLIGLRPRLNGANIKPCRIRVSRLGKYTKYIVMYSGDDKKSIYVVLQYLASVLPPMLGAGRVFTRIIWRPGSSSC